MEKEKHEINAKVRTVTGRGVKALRRTGLLPAVVYGAGLESTPIELDAVEAEKVLSEVGGSTLLTLNVDGETHQVLVREVQRDVIRQDILHADFLNVAMDVTIRTEVPVELVGKAPAVDEIGGLLVAGLSEIEVEALPGNLPDQVRVDLSTLEEIGDQITVGDLDLGEGVAILTGFEEIVATVVYQEEEELEEEVEEELILEGVEPELVEEAEAEEEMAEEEQEEETEAEA